MKISSNAYFAVETLAQLAASDRDRLYTAEALAAGINRSVGFTRELMAELRAAGLVRAPRGPHGGFCLSKPAHRITVAEVFRVFDAAEMMSDGAMPPAASRCSGDDELGGTDLLWQALNSYILLFLEGVSLADIAPAIGGRASGQTIH